MTIHHDYNLTHLTTFGIEAHAKYYAEYSTVKELQRIMETDEYRFSQVLHIGAGSNLLFVHDFDGLILRSAIKGVQFYHKDADTVYAIVGAGETMDDFIAQAVEQGLSGVENLSGIPGQAGASVVQNVGAYGVEASDCIFAVEVFDRITGQIIRMEPEQCRFAYRDSMFKHEGKGRYYVLRVSYLLHPSATALNTEYGPLQHLAESLGHAPSPAEVRDEILRVRNAKLPDPAQVGSAGSFFKNPVVLRKYYEDVVLLHRPDTPHYDVDENFVKIPAGWLIDHAGLKGYSIGGAQVWPKQCLVIANTGNASASDVVELSRYIRRTVQQEYGIELQPEVNFIDTDIEVTILGSGTSKGVPEMGCLCHTCTSPDSHDKRLRASILVQTMGLDILIDASPDLREQALSNDIRSLDAVLLTHQHYDHVGGLDDLRPFCINGDVPIYASQRVTDDIRRRLDYAFREHPYPGVPTLDMHVIEPDKPFDIKGVNIEPIEVIHGKMPILGYRIGKFAYITDASAIDADELVKLHNLDTLIINALRPKPHFAHFNIKQALEMIKKLRPRQAFLTHLCHDFGRHAEMQPSLPENVHIAYDNLHIHIR